MNETNSNDEIFEFQCDINHQKNQLKQDFLKTLGSSSSKNLYEDVLRNSFCGDAFRENDENIFFKFHQQYGHKSLDFVGDFLYWGEQKMSNSLDGRFPIAIINSALLLGAFALNIFVSPAAGISSSIVIGSLAALAEGNFKRNIASFGHLEKHFGDKIYKASQKMLKESGLENDFDHKIDDLSSKSFFLRLLSYVSSFAVSLTEKSLSRFSEIAEFAFFAFVAVLGSIVPILPVINYHLVDSAAKSRHKTTYSEYLFFIKAVEHIFNKIDDIDKLKNLTENFSYHLKNSDLHGNIYGDKNFNEINPSINPDRSTNPKKWITFSSWLFSKILLRLFNSNPKYIEDITKFDSDKKDYFDCAEISLVFCHDKSPEKKEDLEIVDDQVVTEDLYKSADKSAIYLSLSEPTKNKIGSSCLEENEEFGGICERKSDSQALQQKTSSRSPSPIIQNRDLTTNSQLVEIPDYGLVCVYKQSNSGKKNINILRASA